MSDNQTASLSDFGSPDVSSSQSDVPNTDSKFALAFLLGNCTSEGNLEQSSISGYENDVRQGIDMLQASNFIPDVVNYLGGSEVLQPENEGDAKDASVPVVESQESGYASASNAGSQPVGEDFFDIEELASLESEDETAANCDGMFS